MTGFPNNKKFAFTVFDDTDDSTIENVGPVYRFLHEIGVHTTKSVWSLPNVAGARFGGSTLHDRDYLQFVLGLKQQGFEIAIHNVRNFDSPRGLIERGLEDFRKRVGDYPRVQANHHENRDNLYWGPARLSSSASRACYKIATRFKNSESNGHKRDSQFFWGDICRERITYVRNFVFDDVNLDGVNPTMPYHDPGRPFVNYWFSSSEGSNVGSFCRTISEANQDRLEAEGGVCIMYTHFASGFANGTLHPRFESLMRRLAAKDGWFVPVSTLLDHLRNQRGDNTIAPAELAVLERHWLGHKLLHGGS